MWNPFSKTIRLSAVLSPDGKICTAAGEIAAALSCAWAPKFLPAATDDVAISGLCSRWVLPISLEGVSPPGPRGTSR